MIGWLDLNSNPKAIPYPSHLRDEYGLDTITSGWMIGFTFECYERGWVRKKDLDGIDAR